MNSYPSPKRKAAGSIPAGRANIFSGLRRSASQAEPLDTPPKSSAIQRTPCPAAGTAGTGGGSLALLLVVLWLVTASLYRWAERPVEVEIPPAETGGELWA